MDPPPPSKTPPMHPGLSKHHSLSSYNSNSSGPDPSYSSRPHHHLHTSMSSNTNPLPSPSSNTTTLSPKTSHSLFALIGAAVSDRHGVAANAALGLQAVSNSSNSGRLSEVVYEEDAEETAQTDNEIRRLMLQRPNSLSLSSTNNSNVGLLSPGSGQPLISPARPSNNNSSSSGSALPSPIKPNSTSSASAGTSTTARLPLMLQAQNLRDTTLPPTDEPSPQSSTRSTSGTPGGGRPSSPRQRSNTNPLGWGGAATGGTDTAPPTLQRQTSREISSPSPNGGRPGLGPRKISIGGPVPSPSPYMRDSMTPKTPRTPGQKIGVRNVVATPRKSTHQPRKSLPGNNNNSAATSTTPTQTADQPITPITPIAGASTLSQYPQMSPTSPGGQYPQMSPTGPTALPQYPQMSPLGPSGVRRNNNNASVGSPHLRHMSADLLTPPPPHSARRGSGVGGAGSGVTHIRQLSGDLLTPPPPNSGRIPIHGNKPTATTVLPTVFDPSVIIVPPSTQSASSGQFVALQLPPKRSRSKRNLSVEINVGGTTTDSGRNSRDHSPHPASSLSASMSGYTAGPSGSPQVGSLTPQISGLTSLTPKLRPSAAGEKSPMLSPSKAQLQKSEEQMAALGPTMSSNMTTTSSSPAVASSSASSMSVGSSASIGAGSTTSSSLSDYRNQAALSHFLQNYGARNGGTPLNGGGILGHGGILGSGKLNRVPTHAMESNYSIIKEETNSYLHSSLGGSQTGYSKTPYLDDHSFHPTPGGGNSQSNQQGIPNTATGRVTSSGTPRILWNKDSKSLQTPNSPLGGGYSSRDGGGQVSGRSSHGLGVGDDGSMISPLEEDDGGEDGLGQSLKEESHFFDELPINHKFDLESTKRSGPESGRKKTANTGGGPRRFSDDYLTYQQKRTAEKIKRKENEQRKVQSAIRQGNVSAFMGAVASPEQLPFLFIHPSSLFFHFWKLFMVLLVWYSCFETSFVVSWHIIAELPNTYPVLVILNIICDIVMLADIFIYSRKGYYDDTLELQSTARAIRLKYAQTWLIPDLIAGLPLEFIQMIVVSSSTAPHPIVNSLSFQFLKLGRLVKLLKVINFSDTQRSLRINETVRAFFAFVYLLLIGHLVACGFWLTHRMELEVDSNAWTWAKEAQIDDSEHVGKTEQYVAALYWAFATLFTVGFGGRIAKQTSYYTPEIPSGNATISDIIPVFVSKGFSRGVPVNAHNINAQNLTEEVYAIFVVVFAALAYAQVIGNFMLVIENLYRSQSHHEASLSNLQGFISRHCFPPQLEKRVYDFQSINYEYLNKNIGPHVYLRPEEEEMYRRKEEEERLRTLARHETLRQQKRLRKHMEIMEREELEQAAAEAGLELPPRPLTPLDLKPPAPGSPEWLENEIEHYDEERTGGVNQRELDSGPALGTATQANSTSSEGLHERSEDRILSTLPSCYNLEIMLHLHSKLIYNIDLFRDLNSSILSALTRELRIRIYVRGDFVTKKKVMGRRMYLLKRGRVERIEYSDVAKKAAILAKKQHEEKLAKEQKEEEMRERSLSSQPSSLTTKLKRMAGVSTRRRSFTESQLQATPAAAKPSIRGYGFGYHFGESSFLHGFFDQTIRVSSAVAEVCVIEYAAFLRISEAFPEFAKCVLGSVERREEGERRKYAQEQKSLAHEAEERKRRNGSRRPTSGVVERSPHFRGSGNPTLDKFAPSVAVVNESSSNTTNTLTSDNLTSGTGGNEASKHRDSFGHSSLLLSGGTQQHSALTTPRFASEEGSLRGRGGQQPLTTLSLLSTPEMKGGGSARMHGSESSQQTSHLELGINGHSVFASIGAHQHGNTAHRFEPHSHLGTDASAQMYSSVHRRRSYTGSDIGDQHDNGDAPTHDTETDPQDGSSHDDTTSEEKSQYPNIHVSLDGGNRPSVSTSVSHAYGNPFQVHSQLASAVSVGGGLTAPPRRPSQFGSQLSSQIGGGPGLVMGHVSLGNSQPSQNGAPMTSQPTSPGGQHRASISSTNPTNTLFEFKDDSQGLTGGPTMTQHHTSGEPSSDSNSGTNSRDEKKVD